MKSRNKAFLAFAATLLASSAVAAPSIAEALKQVPTSPKIEAKPGISLPAAFTQPPSISNNQTISVSKIEVFGASSVDSAELRSLVSKVEGRSVTLSELNTLCTTITDLYRRKGYFLSRAYVPQQEIQAGVLKLRVIEAKLADITLTNNSLTTTDVIEARLSLADINGHISDTKVEAALAATADLAGVQITRATVAPGVETGSTKLLITTAPKDRWAGSAYVDNYGALYTGKTRAGLSAVLASPTGTGDELSFSLISTTSAGLISGFLRYEKPIYTRSTIFAQFAHTDYQLGGTYTALDAHGKADSAEVGASYVIAQSLTHKFSATFAAGTRGIEDVVEAALTSNPKSDTYGTAAVDFRKTFVDGNRTANVNFGAKLTSGNLRFKDQANATQDLATSNTQGNYTKIEVSAAYSHPVLSESYVSLTVKNQIALNSKNLDGSQKIGVTGSDGLRAYSSSELLGDNGLLAQLEFQSPIYNSEGLKITGGLFFEYAKVSGSNSTSEVVTRSLSDYGLQAIAYYGTWRLNGCLAYGTSSNTVSEPSASTKVTLKISKDF